MEGSGQWPQDKGAIKRIKAAFHLQLAELLRQQHQLVCRPAVTHTDVYKVGGSLGPFPGLTLLGWGRGGGCGTGQNQYLDGGPRKECGETALMSGCCCRIPEGQHNTHHAACVTSKPDFALCSHLRMATFSVSK